MDVMQLTNDNSDVKVEDERSVGEGRVYLKLKIEDWRVNNDYCVEEFQHICRGGACSSRNVCEDDIHMRSKSIFP